MKISTRPSQELRCPFCHDTVDVAEARICPACSSAQHPACDQAHGGCAVCVVYTQRKRRAPASRQRPSRAASDQAQRYGVFSLSLFLISLVAGCLTPLTLGPYPSLYTFIAILTCVTTGAASLFFLAASLWNLASTWWRSRWPRSEVGRATLSPPRGRLARGAPEGPARSGRPRRRGSRVAHPAD